MPRSAAPSAPRLLSKLPDFISGKRTSINILCEELNLLVEGLPRGAVTELSGSPSSGRTTFLNLALAGATQAGEFCALVDASDSFDPQTAAGAGIDLARLLWVRCSQGAPQAFKSADLLLHGGGWGVVVLDLSQIPGSLVRRIPLSYWYRFRRAIESTPTALLVLEQEPYATVCSHLSLQVHSATPVWSGAHPDFRLLQGLDFQLSARKPAQLQTALLRARSLAS